jgi:mono/diheme cytochrome c family protein
MSRGSRIILGSVVAVVLLPAPTRGQADAQRGAEVLKRERCVECHTVAGRGGAAGVPRDLGKRQAQAFTPAHLASAMWNHAPQMWDALAAKGISTPRLREQDSEDLFAYLYSLQFFDRPGDVAQGAVVFEEKGCSSCHPLDSSDKKRGARGPAKGPGAPTAMWSSVSDPVLLVQQMWNHASTMNNAQAAMHIRWVKVTSQDLLDVSAYLNSLPVIHAEPGRFSLPEPRSGKPLFATRCAICHQGTLSLEMRMANMTLTDVAADMWNHAPQMMNAPMLGPTEMRRIVAYVWERQYMGPPGNVAKGRAAFMDKSCAGCHEGQAAVGISRGERVFTPLNMISVVWVHGPDMLKKVAAAGGMWPTLSAEEVADLVAYLNTRP